MNTLERKSHYWRGFWVANAIWAITSIIFLSALVEKLG